MLNIFKSAQIDDPVLGQLRRSRRLWRGMMTLEHTPSVPLVIFGSLTAPDAEALRVAWSLPSKMPSWRPAIERALFEHYSPYSETFADEADVELPVIDAPSAVWPHVGIEYILIGPLDRQLTVEIGYRVEWDEEHTLGARFRDRQLVELCGSVLRP
jgi:hypothetical protein